jgi:hypothetical protein
MKTRRGGKKTENRKQKIAPLTGLLGVFSIPEKN